MFIILQVKEGEYDPEEHYQRAEGVTKRENETVLLSLLAELKKLNLKKAKKDKKYLTIIDRASCQCMYSRRRAKTDSDHEEIDKAYDEQQEEINRVEREMMIREDMFREMVKGLCIREVGKYGDEEREARRIYHQGMNPESDQDDQAEEDRAEASEDSDDD